MSEKSTTASDGIGVVGLLGLLFVALKLLGVIDWSWWWVTMPFWIGFLIFVIFCVAIFMVALYSDYREIKKKRKT